MLSLMASLVIVVMSLKGTAAFLVGSPSCYPFPATTTAIRPRTNCLLFMISKKDKQRQREEQERIEALHSAQLEIQQHALVGKLLELHKKKSNHAAVQKLLKNAAHDGIVDIGSEARRLALEMFYTANRPSDVLMVLSSAAGSKEEREYHQFGLWAHSVLDDWDAAAPYAESLYAGQKEKEAETGVFFSTEQDQNQLRQWAIRAFCHTGRHVDMAREKLWMPDQGDDPEITNAFLNAYLRKQFFQKAKDLWELLLDDEKKYRGCINQESYRLLFQCGIQSGDIPFMKQVIDQLESLTEEDSLLLLQTMISINKSLGANDQALVVTTFHNLVVEDGKRTIKKKAPRLLREPKELLSQLLVALDRPSALIGIFEACQKSSYYSKNWFMSLTPAAKAKILPVLSWMAQKGQRHGRTSLGASRIHQ